MPLPGDINTITVTGTYLNASGSPLAGSVAFTPTVELTDSTGHVVLRATPVHAPLVGGTFTVVLPCTDNTTTSPTSWAWTVTETVSDGPTSIAARTYTIVLPHSLGASVDISTLVPVSPPTPYSTVYGVLTAAQTWTGANTFTAETVVPTPVNAGDASTKAYADTHGPVASVFGRTGDVTATGGDYTFTQVGAQQGLVPTGVKAGGYTAAAGDLVPVDTTSGPVTVTLPSAPADRSVVAVKMVIQGGTNTVTISRGGSDVFNKAGGSTSLTLTLVNQAVTVQYYAAGGIWYVRDDDLALGTLDGRYVAQSSLPLAIAFGGTGSAAQTFLNLGGDVNGGTVSAPQVTATHLASPLPLAQGGTGSATQNFLDLTTAQSAAGVKTFTAAPIINTTTGSLTGLPYGYGASTVPTGPTLISSYPSDDIGGGTDGTSRITLYSYQRANVNSFGETIRNFLMRWDAKAMTAWYGPTGLYDGSGNPVGTAWKPWAWTGAHYEANSHTAIHGHYEIEIPDSTGALQGRFIVPFVDDNPSSGTYGVVGLDVTNIHINQADLTMDSGWGVIRLGGTAGVNDRAIEFSNSIYRTNATAVRWRMMANSTAEAGSNAGSDFAVRRFGDTGSQLGTALWIQRSDGQITTGAAGAQSARIGLVWGTSGIAGFSALPSATIGSAAAFNAQMSASTERVINAKATGDAATRFVAFVSGQHEWGDGTNARDTNLYRSAAGVLKTDNSLQATVALGVGQAPPSTGAAITVATDAAGWASTNTAVAGNVGQPHYSANSATAASLFTTSRVTGDASSRFAARVDGQMSWGSGSASRDTNLYRAAAGIVATDNNLDVVGHALGLWTPRESGLVASTGDPRTVPSGVSAVLGTIYLSAMLVNRAVSVTKILWGVNTAGVSATASQNFVALIDPTGAILASVNVDARVTGTGLFTETIASQALTPGLYRVAFLFNAGTAPQPYRHDGVSASVINAGISAAANYLHATNGTGATALPGSFTLSSNASSSFAYWAAIQ
jgi:hypothetical protein